MAVTVTQTQPNALETVYVYTMNQANDVSTAVPIWAAESVLWQVTAYTGTAGSPVTLEFSLDGTNWVTGQEGAGAAIAVQATSQAAAGSRIYSLQPARFARIVNGATATSTSSVLVVRRSAEAAE